MRLLMIIALGTLLVSPIMADEFKVKLDVDLVDHAEASGVSVQVREKGAEVLSVSLEADGETKFELEKGKLFEIWIKKDGYFPHVIHNVHAEGKSKHSVILYKTTKRIGYNDETFEGINRTFLNVKKMTIPAEYLADGVLTVTEGSLTKDEVVNLKAIAKVAKSQKKAQKKIDCLSKKRDKVEASIDEVKSDMASGKTSKQEGDLEILKLQEKVVKLNAKLKKLAY